MASFHGRKLANVGVLHNAWGSDDAPDEEEGALNERPSKTRRKAESHERQDMGIALTKLTPSALAKLKLPEKLLDSITQLGNTRSHEGKRRQLQYIGKVMRGLDDEDLLRIRVLLAQGAHAAQAETDLLHDTERWRERLLNEEEGSAAFAEAFPNADMQRIRSYLKLARVARIVEKPTAQATRAYRELFQAIRSLQAKQRFSETAAAPDAPSSDDNA